MAPKDDNTSRSSLFFDTQSSFDDNEDETNNKRNDKDWKRRLVVRLQQWFDGTEDEQSSGSSANYYRWAATTVLAMAALTLYRARRRDNDALWKRRLWPLLLAVFRRPDHHAAIEVSLSMLRTAAMNGLVSHALVGSREIVFRDAKGGWKRSKFPPNSAALQSDLLELLSKGGCSEVFALPESIWARLGPPLLAALPFVYLACMYKVLKNVQGGGGGDLKLNNNNHTERPTRFSDIAGLDPIMGEVQELVHFLKDPSSYHAVGAQPPRGVLLHGPPGSGKTLLAQAVAGEANCDAFIACSGSEFCEMYVGRGAARVRSLFLQARSTAQQRQQQRQCQGSFFWWNKSKSSQKEKDERPATAIIFIDELDALAKSRSYGGLTGNDERDQTLNQLLTEMDGFPSQESNVTIIVIAATNRADVLDPAILRRFDRQIHVPYPNKEGRREILKIHARRTQCDLDQIDVERLAAQELTGNFSGSDLRNLVNDAALLAVRDKSKTVRQSHFAHAIRRARAMKANSDLSSTNTAGQPSYLWFPNK
jgi:ATP-dependent Zn protease